MWVQKWFDRQPRLDIHLLDFLCGANTFALIGTRRDTLIHHELRF